MTAGDMVFFNSWELSHLVVNLDNRQAQTDCCHHLTQMADVLEHPPAFYLLGCGCLTGTARSRVDLDLHASLHLRLQVRRPLRLKIAKSAVNVIGPSDAFSPRTILTYLMVYVTGMDSTLHMRSSVDAHSASCAKKMRERSGYNQIEDKLGIGWSSVDGQQGW
jgi:hypothetical protein